MPLRSSRPSVVERSGGAYEDLASVLWLRIVDAITGPGRRLLRSAASNLELCPRLDGMGTDNDNGQSGHDTCLPVGRRTWLPKLRRVGPRALWRP